MISSRSCIYPCLQYQFGPNHSDRRSAFFARNLSLVKSRVNLGIKGNMINGQNRKEGRNETKGARGYVRMQNGNG